MRAIFLPHPLPLNYLREQFFCSCVCFLVIKVVWVYKFSRAYISLNMCTCVFMRVRAFFDFLECMSVCVILFPFPLFLMFKEFCVLWTTFGGMCDFMFRCVRVCVCEEHCFRICSTFGLCFSSPRITQANSNEQFFTGCAGRSLFIELSGFGEIFLHVPYYNITLQKA